MAADAGRVVGAAAGCGVPDPRTIAVSITAIGLIKAAGASPTSLKRAQAVYESVAARAQAETTADPSRCPGAIKAFERAERN